ncbi:hypothetical protein HDU96_003247 [Phlyctochytrium bullatum]|nr:hypothetical protein HDU96_003247 [Phlyctochytrium bullatum]
MPFSSITDLSSPDTSSLASFASFFRQAQDSLPSECLSLETSNVCAPWTTGYYINATAIRLAYGLEHVPTVADWSNVITSLSYGGELLKDVMINVAGCTGPANKGQTVQFMKTNLCLKDVFYYSQGCNRGKVPQHTVCKETCGAYQKALDSLLEDEKACPATTDKEVLEERKNIAQDSETCTSLVKKWTAQVPGYETSCYNGVQDDLSTCGLGGNLEEAASYCKKYPTAKCCEAYKKAKESGYKGVPSPTSEVLKVPKTTAVAATATASATSVPAPSKALEGYPECIPIDETTACAPWSKGYYINATAIGLQYGLSPLKDARDWDEAITMLTLGGDLLKQVLGDYTGCTGYQGEPIQFLKTYVCLIDIFDFSERCNRVAGKVPPRKPLCTDTCKAYGASVQSLIADPEACPNLEGKVNATTWEYVKRTRKDVADGGKYCAKGVEGWQTGSQGCIGSVDSDYYSCGFGGNLEVAKKYCADLKAKGRNPSCCSELKQLPRPLQRLASAAASGPQERDGQPAPQDESFISKNKTAVIIGSVVAAVLVLVAVVACVAVKRRGGRRSSGGRVRVGSGAANGKNGNAYHGYTVKEAAPFVAGQKNFGTTGAAGKGPIGGNGRSKVVLHPYTPQLSDEIELRPDDIVEVLAEYDDGWGKGQNTRTGAVGTFPMACLR